MKRFMCKEMRGPNWRTIATACDEIFEGDTAMEAAEAHMAHIMSTAAEAHKPMSDKMSTETAASQEGGRSGATGSTPSGIRNKTISLPCRR